MLRLQAVIYMQLSEFMESLLTGTFCGGNCITRHV